MNTCVQFFIYPITDLAVATTLSTVKPNSLNSSPAGADSPNDFIQTTPHLIRYIYTKIDQHLPQLQRA